MMDGVFRENTVVTPSIGIFIPFLSLNSFTCILPGSGLLKLKKKIYDHSHSIASIVIEYRF